MPCAAERAPEGYFSDFAPEGQPLVHLIQYTGQILFRNGQNVFQCNFIRESDVTKNGNDFPTGAGNAYFMISARGTLKGDSWATTYHDERTTSVKALTFTTDEKHVIINSA